VGGYLRVLSRRLSALAPLLAATTTASILVIPPLRVAADPPDRAAPAGASQSAPGQHPGSAAGRPHAMDPATTAAGATVDAAELEPPEVPGAVGPERRYPAVDIPDSAAGRRLSLTTAATAVEGFVPGQSTELTAERTPRSTVFLNPDGTKTLRIYDGVAFVEDQRARELADLGMALAPGELLQPVDPTLWRRADGRVVPVRAGEVSFADQASDPELAWIDAGPGASVAFGLAGAAEVEPVLDGAVVTYPGVRPESDIRFTASSAGVKEEIVLHSPDAPGSWLFPLHLAGVTPSLDGATGNVVFTDAAGEVRGRIPPGYMVDSNVDPRRGDGEQSYGVGYSLLRAGEGWALRVDLDEQWLSHPDRVYPVVVDPNFQRNADGDDTFVSSRDFANQDNSSRNDLLAGTYNGGANRAASYLDFAGLLSARPNRWVHGAALNVYNYWSFSCAARPVDVYRVTRSWSGSSTTRWAGPSYDSRHRLARSSFAYGYFDCPQGGWGTFTLPADRVMRWLHGTESFHGLTLRASESDSRGWKRFWSTNSSDPVGRPYIDLNYADQGAKYSLPSGRFNPPVTGAAAGRITVRVANWGMTTWTPTNGYRLRVRVLNAAGTVVQNVPFITMPRNVGPHKSVDIPVTVQALTPGNYTLQIYMVTPDTVAFQDAHSVPFAQSGFRVANGPPTIAGNQPAHNGQVATLKPTLWADYDDPDNFPNAREFRYRVCAGAPGGGGACRDSGWTESATWPVPSGVAVWDQPAHWYVRVSDTQASSPEIGPFVFTPVVAQPAVTGHLTAAPDGADAPGLNPLIGNYSTTARDVSVEVAGPPLEIRRTYNSQDFRQSGAFGAGWSSPVEQRITVDPDGSGNVVVTLDSGRQLRLGRNPDGSYTPPRGTNVALVRSGSPPTWTLRDSSGIRRTFDQDGRLVLVTDTDGREQSYTYDSAGKLIRIEDRTSGRGLTLGWSGTRVTSVMTDSAGDGRPRSRWTYGYSGNQLVQACVPLSAQSCATYEYEESSHYRAVALNDNPTAYWPFGETGGSVATDLVGSGGGRYNASYGEAALGAAGAVRGSTDTAATFDGSAHGGVSLPRGLVNTAVGFALELWFKLEPGDSGVLWSSQNDDLASTPSRWAPLLSVTEGGDLAADVTTINPNARYGVVLLGSDVADGQWHHVVLTGSPGLLELYRDGTERWEVSEELEVSHFDRSLSFVGNGRESTAGGNAPLAGSVDEAAFYRHRLDAGQVAAHFAARNASRRLVRVVEPGGHVATEVGYDTVTGRVSSLRDRHGEQWTLATPSFDDGDVSVVLASEGAGSVTYGYDAEHGGRLTTRTDAFGEQQWEYNAAGFVSKAVDANGNATTFATDARGNVVGRTTCRDAGNCSTEYFGYFLNAANSLDPRNDVLIWQSDGRSASATDTTYRTSYEIDSAGRVVRVTRPRPDGHATAPVERFEYSSAVPFGLSVNETSRPFIRADDTVLPLTDTAAELKIDLPFSVAIQGDRYRSVTVNANGFLEFGDFDAFLDVFSHGLDLGTAGSVRTAVVGTAPEREFVIEWRNVALSDDPNRRLSFEAVFPEGGDFWFNYTDLDGLTEQIVIPSVGVAADGGYLYSAEGSAPDVANGTSVVFTPAQGSPPSYGKTTRPATFVPVSTVLPITGTTNVAEVALPFPFRLYGVQYNSAWVSMNGHVNFAAQAEDWLLGGGSLPSPRAPNAAVYPFWDNLVADATSSVRSGLTGTAPNRRFIIEWRDVYISLAGPGKRFSLQAILSENGEIAFNYQGIDTGDLAQARATVGIEDAAGANGVLHSSYVPVVRNETAIEFSQTGSLAGMLSRSIAANGAVTTYEHNRRGDLVRTVGPTGLAADYGYDAFGRVTSVSSSSPAGDYGTTTFTYNALSQVVTETAPPVRNPVTGVTHTHLTTHAYDAAGRRTGTTITDATGGGASRGWIWAYDPAGRLISMTAPDGGVTTQEWDSRGDLVRTTDPAGLVLEHTYDGAHRLIETAAVGDDVDPMDAGATRLVLESRAYDPGGRLASIVDAMGQETTYTYYGDNLPASETRVRRAETGEVTSETPLSGYGYDRAGMLTQLTATGGVITTYRYDPAGYLVSERLDPTGLNRTRAYERNLDGTLAAVVTTGAESPGRSERTSFTYDPAGQPLTSTVHNQGGSPAALTTTYTRDPRGLVTVESDPSGVETRYAYDVAGRVVTVTGEARDVWSAGTRTVGAAPVTTVGRNAFGEVTHEQDPTGAVTRLTLDAMGRSTETHLPAYTPPGGQPIAAIERVQYDQRGLPIAVTDPLGRVTASTYDVYGRLAGRTLPDPDGSGPQARPVWSYGYDRLGRLLKVTDPAGGQALATYDDLNRQITETVTERTTGSTLFLTTELGYDEAGNPTSRTSPLGLTTTTDYNRAGQPSRVTDPSGRFIQYTYDLAGRPVATVNGDGTGYVAPVTRSSYDLAGRAVGQSQCTVTSAGSCGTVLRASTTTYDGSGHPVQAVTAEGRVTGYGYDSAGQLTTVAQQREHAADVTSTVTVELGYDAAGRRSRMVDGNGNATVYTYTPWGLPASVTEPSTPAHPAPADRTWTTVYDAAGQAVQERLPGGVTRTRGYDGLGNLVSESGTGAQASTADRQLGYDLLGRIVSVGGPSGATTYSWDDRGLLVGSAGPAGTASFAYDGDGRWASRTDASGSATFTYHPMGALATAADPLTGRSASYAYNRRGQVETVSWSGAGARRQFGHDDLGRITSDSWHRPDGSTVASTGYTYDDDDLILTEVTAGLAGAGSNGYGYDGLGRLTSWRRPDGVAIAYGYDNSSNRTTVAGPGGTRTATYDARNRLLSATGGGEPALARTWTARGTLASSTEGTAATAYTADAFERMVSVSGPVTGTIGYAYDALDRLVSSRGQPHRYADLSNDPVQIPAGGTQSTLVSRIPGGSPLSSRAGTAAGQALLADQLHGDVVAAADAASGSLSASVTYQPYGEIAAASGTLPLGFQGGWNDPATGQVNAHARWYDPDSGTFTSRDTWTLDPDPVAAANRYLYGNGDPVRNSDPSGHWPCILCDVIGGVIWDIINAEHAGEACDGPYGTKPDAGHWSCGRDNWGPNSAIQPAPSYNGFGSAPGGSYADPRDSSGGGGWPLPFIPPVFIPPPVAPRPGPTPTQRPRWDDPTGGRGIRNPPPPPPQPRITRDDEGGSGPTAIPPGGSGAIPPVVAGPLGLVARVIAQLGEAAAAEALRRLADLLADSDEELTRAERERRDDCLSGEWSGPTIVYDPLDRTIVDGVGVASGAEACFPGMVPPRGPGRPYYTPPGFVSGAGMDRAHLVGRSLGGNGRLPENIVPLFHPANYQMYLACERVVKGWAEAGETVYYRVEPQYRPGNPVPYELRVVIVGTGHGLMSCDIQNR
jgi:RHS repeat-associated protein